MSSIIISPLGPLHASPLAGDFHWEYQLLTLLIIAGVWLFFAGRSERRVHRHKRQRRDH